MPYITQGERERIDAELRVSNLETPGQLSYAVTQLALQYINQHGRSYRVLSEVAGTLTLTLQELYQRVIQPYEARKWRENGDVFR